MKTRKNYFRLRGFLPNQFRVLLAALAVQMSILKFRKEMQNAFPHSAKLSAFQGTSNSLVFRFILVNYYFVTLRVTFLRASVRFLCWLIRCALQSFKWNLLFRNFSFFSCICCFVVFFCMWIAHKNHPHTRQGKKSWTESNSRFSSTREAPFMMFRFFYALV